MAAPIELDTYRPTDCRVIVTREDGSIMDAMTLGGFQRFMGFCCDHAAENPGEAIRYQIEIRALSQREVSDIEKRAVIRL